MYTIKYLEECIMKNQYTLASKPKTLQELFSTRGIIQIGKKDSIKMKGNRSISILPSFFVVNDEAEVWAAPDTFQFKIDKNGILSFHSGEKVNEEFVSFLQDEKIEKVQIKSNIVWIWRDGKPCKLYYYAMKDRCIKDASTHETVEFISGVQVFKIF